MTWWCFQYRYDFCYFLDGILVVILYISYMRSRERTVTKKCVQTLPDCGYAITFFFTSSDLYIFLLEAWEKARFSKQVMSNERSWATDLSPVSFQKIPLHYSVPSSPGNLYQLPHPCSGALTLGESAYIASPKIAALSLVEKTVLTESLWAN